MANRDALLQTIEEVFSGLPTSDIIALLEKAAIAYARLNSVQQFADHPQLRARQRWCDVESPVGPLPAMLPPATIAGVTPRMDAIPDVGQQTDAILDELGYSSDTIGRWRQAGFV